MDEQRQTSTAPRSGSAAQLLAMLAFAACSAPGAERPAEGPPTPGPVAAAPGDRSAACPAGTAGTVERRPLVLPDGTEAYVEPGSVLRVRDAVVVVGTPSYTWELGGDRAVMASDGMHLAAYLDDDAPRLVEKPVEGTVGAVRSVALGDGRWGVLFTVLDPAGPTPVSFTDLWYAEFDGARWTTLERLPLPEEGELFVDTSSPLVRDGEGLAWAVVHNPGGGALYYQRRGGGWRFERIQDQGVEVVGLAVGPSGTWLALSGVVPGMNRPRKAVRLFVQEDGWRLVSLNPTQEDYTEIYYVSVMVLPGGVTLTWLEILGQGLAMARVGIGRGRPGTIVVVDDSAPVVRSLALADGEPAWVVQHNDMVARVAELRLVRPDDDGDVRVARAMPNPYTGFFAATATGPDEVLVTGSEFSPDPARATVRSLTLRLSSSCQ